MFYSIKHLTKFHYASPVSESVMEARMHPRSEQGLVHVDVAQARHHTLIQERVLDRPRCPRQSAGKLLRANAQRFGT